MQKFYANGKLLLTGEYLVLDGAQALALPTKHGQGLIIEERKEKGLKWESYDEYGNVGFNIVIHISTQRMKILLWRDYA